MHKEELKRIETQIRNLQLEWEIRIEKLAALERRSVFESDVFMKFQLERQIQLEMEEINRLASLLSQIEQNLNHGTASAPSQQPLNRSESLNVQGAQDQPSFISSGQEVWDKTDRIAVVIAGGAALGGAIAQIPGAIVGAALAAVYGWYISFAKTKSVRNSR